MLAPLNRILMDCNPIHRDKEKQFDCLYALRGVSRLAFERWALTSDHVACHGATSHRPRLSIMLIAPISPRPITLGHRL